LFITTKMLASTVKFSKYGRASHDPVEDFATIRVEGCSATEPSGPNSVLRLIFLVLISTPRGVVLTRFMMMKLQVNVPQFVACSP
jgi:hypothetical protein